MDSVLWLYQFLPKIKGIRNFFRLLKMTDGNFFFFICSMDALGTMLSHSLFLFSMLSSKTWESTRAIIQENIIQARYYSRKYCTSTNVD